MQNFKFSIVMAVYNVEIFLEETVESVLKQDIGFEENVQLILVDDGSKDSSGEICDKYARQYPKNIVVVHKANGGVASARNEGLKYACGRYINFMDSDDKFTPNVLSLVYKFFSGHETEVDLVTIPLEFFDAIKGDHVQNYKFKNGTRIIDLNEEYDATLMFVNATFFVNRVKNKIHFDSKLVVGEDQKVILTILSDKMRYGVVAECRYLYRRRGRGELSLIQSSKKKYGWYFDYFTYLIDWGIQFFKEKHGNVSGFVQYQFLFDLSWRIKEIYDPTIVLTAEEAEQYKKRLWDTYRKFDDKYILGQRILNTDHKNYILRKKGQYPVHFNFIDKDVVVSYGENQLCNLSMGYTKLELLNIYDDTVTIEGFTKLLYFGEEEDIEIYLVADNKKYLCSLVDRSDFDDYRFDELICKCYGFKGRIKLTNIEKCKVSLMIRFRGHEIMNNNLNVGKFFPLLKRFKNAYVCKDNILVQLENNTLKFNKVNIFDKGLHELKLLGEIWSRGTKAAKKAVLSRLMYHFVKPFKKNEIWLVSDRINKADDNGEALFRYLNQNNMPVDAYFVIQKDSEDMAEVSKIGKVLDYLSWKHKFYHLLADKTVSASFDDHVYNPFQKSEVFYRDILWQKYHVFLQHGVTKDDLSRWLNKYNKNLSMFVTSAVPEYDSILTGNYFYDDSVVKLVGFPRYDRLVDNSEKVIMIMPTWRAYLCSDEDYQKSGMRKYDESFRESAYFKYYNSLINNETLIKAAKRLGYKIKFMPHPYIMSCIDWFEKKEGVEFCDVKTKYGDAFAVSNLIVTDYSSTAFDFAYLRKPILYTQFDKETFFKNHTYKAGYFEYERDGFGEVEYDLDSTIARIIEYMENGCQLKDKYRERIDRFFAYNDRNNCKRVYEAIRSLDKK